jgi:hypothetical protein
MLQKGNTMKTNISKYTKNIPLDLMRLSIKQRNGTVNTL